MSFHALAPGLNIHVLGVSVLFDSPLVTSTEALSAVTLDEGDLSLQSATKL